MESDETSPWNDLRVLLALHRHRSFLAAGKALGMSTSTAARRIDALEASLGRPLVQRSTTGTSVEPDALELVALAEQIELGLRAIRRDRGAEALQGTVRVSMGEGALLGLTQRLCELRRLHPELQLEILSETRLVDLARREADVAVRGSRSTSPAIIQRVVGRAQFGLYAGPDYIERRLRGARLQAADFARHDFLGYDDSTAQAVQAKWLARHGAKRFVIRSNSELALLEAARQGQGLVLLPDAMVRTTPGLVRIDTQTDLPSMTLYLAYHRDLRNLPRVRLVVTTLETTLRAAL